MDKLKEEWVDIIREWQTEPYPPMRPLAEKIVKAIKSAKEEERGEIYNNLVKIADPELGWVRMSRVANLLLAFDNDLKKAEKKWKEMEEYGKKI